MKATDLMIGDWVYGLYPDGSRYKPPFRISAVDTYPSNRSPRIVTEGGYGFQEEHLAPIPITGGILEKNGFSKTPRWTGNNFFALADDYYLIQIERYSDGIWQFRHYSRDMDVPPSQILFSSVHELQHALRLCGIEKEIII